MKSRPRMRKAMKWSGTVLTVLLVVVWVGSGWWSCGVATPNVVLRIEGGRIGGLFGQYWSIMFEATDWDGLSRHSDPFYWWFDFWTMTTTVNSATDTNTFFDIPIWFIALFPGVPTLWLWYRDRRKAPGLCGKCGYDLRGAAHDVCPECGVAVHFAEPPFDLAHGEQQHPTKPDIID